MSVWRWLIGLRDDAFCLPQSREGALYGKPSNSEIRRWVRNRSIRINGVTEWEPDEEGPDTVWDLVFFPKKPGKVTLI